MATPTNLLRLCLRPGRRLPSLGAVPARQAQQRLLRRPLSTTPPCRRDDDAAGAAEKDKEKDEDEDEYDRFYSNPGLFLRDLLRDETISDHERRLATQMLEDWNKVPPNVAKGIDSLTKEINELGAPMRRPVQARQKSFWNEEEDDPDLITDEVGEDDFEEDDMMAVAHAKLEEHREFREYARVAVWEMPLLSKLAKPFQPPAEDQVLRFRYTTYMGEFHPADRKVVVEFCPEDLPGLTEAQVLKLKKLAGPRYNPEKGIIKMSSDRFEHQAQNKRYLGDLVNKMIAAAKDPADMFEDVPLDTRHHAFKKPIKFPKEWYMTEERRQQLLEQRKQALLLDEAKRNSEDGLVDGRAAIEQALLNAPKVEQMVPVGGRLRISRRV
ncbi:hypothetical protein VTJ83DRAFT_7468 [Remersonia thermophila]|uniref:Small ribosomal subunit protein mS35 mitochondrial conserved domain-containing protein n=1 Tax=Remersonia thermophila TaxID=72144 RepID=A0ABR4D3R0_9PEZI